ncbi:MAG: MFS transporter [Candidatus Moraniibacteriota bacterium]|nr:MAG: MFS transporter [Candidatus Moranbacteria bacterium]
MSRYQKIFLAILSLYVIFDFTLGTLVGLFLWETTKEASQVVLYYISLFLSITMSTQVASKLTHRYGAKKVYISSIILGMLQAGILMIMGSDIAKVIIPFGILAGAGIGLQAMSYSLIVGFITNNTDTTKFLGLKSSIMNAVNIVSVPIITSLISALGSYEISYLISLCVGLLIIILVSKIPVATNKDSIITTSYSSLLEIDEVKIFVTTRLLYGIFNGPMWAILGVVTFMFVGDVSRWGYISTGFTILSIISAYLYSKVPDSSLRRAISITATFIFASVALLLATNWNFTIFMIYQFAVVLLNSSFSLHYEGVIYGLVNDNELIKDNMNSVLSLGEIAMGIGRVSPLVVLLISGFSFDNPLMLQILFVLISVVPLLILNKLNSLIPHSSRYATIHN